LTSTARFCRRCGAAVAALPPRAVQPVALGSDWYTLQAIVNQRDKLYGLIGVVLIFFGAFLPWSSQTVDILFWRTSVEVASSTAVLFAGGALLAGILLFRRGQAHLLLVLGTLTAGWTLLSALIALSHHASPAWGMGLTLAGGACLAYSGYLTAQYDGR
jgi:hypothetical protein